MFLPLCLALAGLPLAQGPGDLLDRGFDAFSGLFPENSFFNYSNNLRALTALVLVSVSCGAVGSLVVGGRMAFFSDALAHCAFAGVSIGFLLWTGLIGHYRPRDEFWEWVTPIMVSFGILVGLGIAFVRSQTGLASDTVIGVFFAGAIGLYAMLRKLMHNRALFNLEDFLFGNPLLVTGGDLLALAALALLTGGLLYRTYNGLLLGSFNTSLALSRRVPVRLNNYLFVMLLALIVNLCLRTVGALLINALLVVPAASAANVSRNMRSMFWLTIALSVIVSVGGQALSWQVAMGHDIPLDMPGTIILLSVFAFLLSMLFGPWYRSRPARDGSVSPPAASPDPAP